MSSPAPTLSFLILVISDSSLLVMEAIFLKHALSYVVSEGQDVTGIRNNIC